MRQGAFALAITAVVFVLAGCGGSAQDQALSPEERTYAEQVQKQLDDLRASVEQLNDEVKDRQAVEGLKQVLAEADAAVAALRVSDTEPFNQKKAAAERALTDLGRRYADVLARSKIPGLPPAGQ